MNLEAVLETTIIIAKEAGKVFEGYFKSPVKLESKRTSIDIVTEGDKAVEKSIVIALQNAFPDHHIVGEEGGGQGAPRETAEYHWYIDPIDGTTNFANKLPYCCTSIAISDRELNPLIGVVYSPMLKELFTAYRGGGAFLNGEPIQVSGKTDLGESIIVSGFPYDKWTSSDNNLKEWSNFLIRTRATRCLGSAALDLAYIAAGRVEGYWERGVHPWDTLAGMLLVEEAGGQVSDYQGQKKPQLRSERKYVASNGKIHQAIIEVLNH